MGNIVVSLSCAAYHWGSLIRLYKSSYKDALSAKGQSETFINGFAGFFFADKIITRLINPIIFNLWFKKLPTEMQAYKTYQQ